MFTEKKIQVNTKKQKNCVGHVCILDKKGKDKGTDKQVIVCKT
jgi:hypothetical protein